MFEFIHYGNPEGAHFLSSGVSYIRHHKKTSFWSVSTRGKPNLQVPALISLTTGDMYSHLTLINRKGHNSFKW